MGVPAASRGYSGSTRPRASSGCQLEFFDLTLNEILDLGLQRRLGDSPHLEGERN